VREEGESDTRERKSEVEGFEFFLVPISLDGSICGNV
jgi:hypothetical protein